MGTATHRHVLQLRNEVDAKHFIPLWGQQRHHADVVHLRSEKTFHTPMGTATRLREALSRTFRETFHTPMGTATPRKCNHHTDR